MSAATDVRAIDLHFLRPHSVGTLIRVGREEDGGYVVPAAAVEETRLLLGIGINDDWSFEEDFAVRNPAARIVGVDGTAGLRLLYRKVASRALQGIGSVLTFQFRKAARKFGYRAKIPRFREFFSRHTFLRLMLRAQPERGGITLGQLVEKHRVPGGGEPDVFLKIDIEGGEYDVLRSAGSVLDAVLCLTVEFHDLDQHGNDLRDIAAAMETDFLVAHVHGNNYSPLIAGTAIPSVLEVTWLRRNLAPANPQPATGPWPVAGLDRPCNPKAADYPLRFDEADHRD